MYEQPKHIANQMPITDGRRLQCTERALYEDDAATSTHWMSNAWSGARRWQRNSAACAVVAVYGRLLESAASALNVDFLSTIDTQMMLQLQLLQ